MPELSHIDPRSAALLPQLPNFLKSRQRIPRLQAQNSHPPICECGFQPLLSGRAQLPQPFNNFLRRGIRSACICLAPVAIKTKKFRAFSVKHPRH
jgi:hypothetical protein